MTTDLFTAEDHTAVDVDAAWMLGEVLRPALDDERPAYDGHDDDEYGWADR